jgi:hypothetical protein
MFPAAQDFTGTDEDKGQNKSHDCPDARSEKTAFDGVAHQEKTAEGKREAADPNRPSCA